MDIRIGQGFDAHRFAEGRKLIIGGIEIPHKLGLAGHSDADVLIHAIIDSILGAIAAGDIGNWFPDNDSKFKNIDSKILLEKVICSDDLKGWTINNIDCTIICEKPKILPYVMEMKEVISRIAGIDISRVSIKGKTSEKMGFCGREEGIATIVNTLLIKE